MSSLDRESSKLKRAARRLRKKGYSAEAGKMMMASETARLNEPSIMTPMYRAQQSQAHELVSYAQTVATDPTFDYEKDIKPLRQAFFGGVATSGLSANQQDMITSRYAPEFDSIEDRAIKDRSNLQSIRNSDLAYQNAQLQLAEAKNKIQREREAEEMMPEMAERLDNILSGDEPAASKYQGVTSFINKNPNFFTSPAGSKLANNALTSIPQASQLRSRTDALDPAVRLAVDAALNANSVSGMEKIIQDHRLAPDIGESLLTSVRDKVATAEGEQVKLQQRAIYDSFNLVRKDATSISGDTAAPVARVDQVRQRLGQVLVHLGASSGAYDEFKEALDVEIEAVAADTSKSGSPIHELGVQKASNELKRLMNAAVIDVNNLILKSLKAGTSLTAGGRGRDIDPSAKNPGVSNIRQTAGR